MNRRNFIKNISLATSVAFAPTVFAQKNNAKQKHEKNPLRFAFVGTGLMGGVNMSVLLKQLKQQCVAVCDVDTKYGAVNQRRFAPKAQVFIDYREMFEKLDGKIDGVVISTPDNSHFSIAMTALKYKIPVYLEKPLCHSIEQIRLLTEKANKVGVPTQMGNHVHSGCGIDYVREYINAGAIGTVKEIIAWTCRPLKGCNQPPKGWTKWPKPDKIPATLDWDKWLNTTEYTDYYDAVVPLNWRRFFKFGSGSLGDIGCHIIDVPITALNLPAPTLVQSRQRGGTSICVPYQDEVIYHFPTRSQGVPVKLSWYSGVVQPDENGNFPAGYDVSFLPKLPKEYTDMKRGYKQLSNDRMFIIGTEGVIYSPTMHLMGKPVLLPMSRAKSLKDELDKRTSHLKNTSRKEHILNFVQAISGDVKKCNSDFSDAGPLSETVQLGNVALQTGTPIKWNSEKMSCLNNPKADTFIKPIMREGFC